ncbi:MAG: hypothetical protein QOD60_1288 [Solirubrobacterales bacterium]|jgi:WS/DGAT/MGAT family acyltransferase|nr:hypothetical protein [Solirubrobacterales bacterium]
MPIERLSADDNRILDLERGAIAGHTLKVIVCDRASGAGPPIVERLRHRISERIERVPRCRQMIKPSRVGRPSWTECPGFDPADQVRRVDEPRPLDAEALRLTASRLMAERLPRDRPLWKVDVVEQLAGGGFALIVRTHHAMADGVTTMRMARELFFDQADAPAPSMPAPDVPGPSAATRLVSTAREIAGMPGTWRRELSRSGSSSPFAAQVGAKRDLAFVAAPLGRLKSMGKAVGPHVTLNDVVLAVSAGGIRRWLELRGDATEGLRAKVPVSLHNHDHDAHALGNHDSFMFVDLPVGESDPVRRLLAINAETADRKNHHDAEALDAMLRGLHETGGWGRAVERRSMDPRVFTVNISNVPGPRDEVTIFGGRMRRLLTVAEIAEMHALRISVVSACGQMFFGLCADPEVVPGLDQMASGIEAEIAELGRAAA